jgi:hypothetical protein
MLMQQHLSVLARAMLQSRANMRELAFMLKQKHERRASIAAGKRALRTSNLTVSFRDQISEQVQLAGSGAFADMSLLQQLRAQEMSRSWFIRVLKKVW